MKSLAIHLLLLAFRGRVMEHLGNEPLTIDSVNDALATTIDETMAVIRAKLDENTPTS